MGWTFYFSSFRGLRLQRNNDDRETPHNIEPGLESRFAYNRNSRFHFSPSDSHNPSRFPVVDPLGIPKPHLPMRRLNIFGNRDQVYRALMIVNKAIVESYKPEPPGTIQAADEWDVVLDHQHLVDSNDFLKVSEAQNDSNVSGAEIGCGAPNSQNTPRHRIYS